MATYDQTEILWDKYKNVPNAYPGSSYLANQAVGNAFPQIVPNSQTWSSQIPPTAPASLGSVVNFTNGSYRQSTAYPWIRRYTVTMGAIQAPGISYWYASTDVNNPLTTNVCRDTIPFNFDPIGSYNIQVFANGVAVSPTFAAYPWNYDESAGVLTFYPANPAVLPPTPITMTYWRYVGGKGGGAALDYWTISDPSPGSILYFTPSTGTAANIYITNNAQFLLAGPSNGYLMYDRTNTNAYWETYSTADTLTFGYNGAGTTLTKGTLSSAGQLGITGITVGGTNQITYNGASFRTIFSGGNGILVNGGISAGISYASAGIVGLALVCNAGVTNVFEVYNNTGGATPIFTINNNGVNSLNTITAPNFTGLASSASTITTSTAGAGTFFPVFTTAGTGGTSRVLSVDAGLSYVASTDTLTCGTFVGALTGGATLIDTTLTTTNATYFIPFVPLSSSQPNGQVLGTDGGLTYNPSNNFFEVLNGRITSIDEALSGTLSFKDTITPANEFLISHTNGVLQFNNAWSALPFPLEVDGDGLGVFTRNIKAQAYEPSGVVQLDTPSIRDSNDQGVLFEANTANDYSAIPTQTGTTWTIVVDGYNPNSRDLTFSFGVSSLQDLIVTFSSASAQSFNPTIGTVTATRNGSGFTAFNSTSSTASGTVFSYTSSTSNNASYRIRQPITQYTLTFIPTNSGITDTYVFTFPITMNYTATSGYSWTNRSLEYNPTNFAYSYTQLTGLILIPGIIPGASPAGTSMISAETLTKDLFQTSTRTIECDYLQAEYIGLVGDYTLSGTTGSLLRCFRGNYDHFELQLRFTSAPTNGTRFTIQLATGGGTASVTGYNGAITGTGNTLSFLAYGATTGAILFSVSGNQGVIYTAKIFSPNISRTTTFQASNIGTDGSLSNVPFISNGFHTVTTSYPSLVWTASNSINASLLIKGFN
jgi:hypothetical protein